MALILPQVARLRRPGKAAEAKREDAFPPTPRIAARGGPSAGEIDQRIPRPGLWRKNLFQPVQTGCACANLASTSLAATGCEATSILVPEMNELRRR
jgi:hypothetical protein